MSFMFHPYPYVDPNAVNPINAPESVKKGLVKGPQAVAKEIARQIKAGKTRVGIDCYAGAEIGALARQLEEFVENAELIDATALAMDEKELDEKLAPYLPTGTATLCCSTAAVSWRATRACRTPPRCRRSKKSWKRPRAPWWCTAWARCARRCAAAMT